MFFIVGLFLTIFLFCFPSAKYTYTPPGMQKEPPEVGVPLNTFTITSAEDEEEEIVTQSKA